MGETLSQALSPTVESSCREHNQKHLEINCFLSVSGLQLVPETPKANPAVSWNGCHSGTQAAILSKSPHAWAAWEGRPPFLLLATLSEPPSRYGAGGARLQAILGSMGHTSPLVGWQCPKMPLVACYTVAWAVDSCPGCVGAGALL